ncbi:hypothetical protein SAMN05216466_113235 [Paraburkholderia phenazinium]|uniref:Uncharacterized protein n=1 Tax=Paraburkholderia phenazinium TaxID=60549 RepID=A0A1G8FL81_9BURK|nr:hypothetical protein SAMN05216466_113235 [Paraburkholderia phenazinium]
MISWLIRGLSRSTLARVGDRVRQSVRLDCRMFWSRLDNLPVLWVEVLLNGNVSNTHWTSRAFVFVR